MKQLFIFLTLAIAFVMCKKDSQRGVTDAIFYKDVAIQKTTPSLKLTGAGANINFNSSDVTITLSSNLLTFNGGNVSLGTNSLLMTGSLGATDGRLTKAWLANLEVTNPIVGSITGSAATLTTPRAIYGNNFNGSAALTQIIGSAYGGTGNAYFLVSGPASSVKTYTFPNTNSYIATLGRNEFTARQIITNGGLYADTVVATVKVELPANIHISQLPADYTPDTILAWHNHALYYTTKDKLSDILYPVDPPVNVYGTYIVAPNGSDSNPGTYASPFLTLEKAWSMISAGDTIYMRGGTYNYVSRQDLASKDGSAGDSINIWNYPGEIPIINGGAIPTNEYSIIAMSNTDYISMRGIKLTNLPQPNPSSTNGYYGLRLQNDVNHCRFENMEISYIGGWGCCMFTNCTYITFKNCDSHHHYDPYSTTPYDGSDGWQTGGSSTVTHITWQGCRSWSNSDDGWDTYTANGLFTWENCWTMYNGYREDGVTTGGNGEGFKFGSITVAGNPDTIKRRAYNCISSQNRSFGYEANNEGYYVAVLVYNCFAYHNGVGFQCENGTSTETRFRNNISWLNHNGNDVWFDVDVTDDHNDWNGGVTVSAADFDTWDEEALVYDRQANGNLPIITAFHLVSGSDLINKGINVGLPYLGAAPDLGAFEKQ